MYSIYKITNTENGKVYIGQTNNWNKRFSHYKSIPFNEKSSEYNRPINAAIRKYGINKFNFEIIEEIDDAESQEYIDARESFFIQELQSLVIQNGYNIQLGGQGSRRVPLNFEDSIKLSKLFTKEEVYDIHNLLINDTEYSDILLKYPQLSSSFLSNINVGLNFINPELNYPLKKSKPNKSQYSLEEQKLIKQDIKNGISYSKICEKWNVKSLSFLTGVNNGKYWFDSLASYPLSLRMSNGAPSAIERSEHTKSLLIFSDLTFSEIATKVGYSNRSAVTAINVGRNRKDKNLSYPLRNNQEKNKLCFKSNIVSTISS